MKKQKIEIGQCYESNDRVFMILRKAESFPKGWWVIQDTLTQREGIACESQLVGMRRPFQNFG
jgi:hypothetical protein